MGDRLHDAPIGATAPAIGGGRWYKMPCGGWKWNGPLGPGGIFPRPGADWTGALQPPAAHEYDRDVRQAQVAAWVEQCWGPEANNIVKRVERLLEEAFELAQAERISPERLQTIQAKVYEKEPGEPAQEVGGIGTTLLAYCAARRISADQCERSELTRILNKPVEHFRRRHQAKIDSGLARDVCTPLPSTTSRP